MTQEVGRSTRLRLVFTLHFFRALVTSLRALSQNKARFWLFCLLNIDDRANLQLLDNELEICQNNPICDAEEQQ